MNKITILLIEFGFKNLDKIKKTINKDHISPLYATSFLDIIDIIMSRTIDGIIISDYRGINATSGYIKMFKKTAENIKLVILSADNSLKSSKVTHYLQEGADFYSTVFNEEEISNWLYSLYYIKNNLELNSNKWRNCTKKAINCMKRYYNIFDFNYLSDISERIQYSRFTVSKFVKEDTGKNVFLWLQEIRINAAINLLNTGNYQVKFIAEEVGYYSLQGFLKSFKKITGMTPKKYTKEIIKPSKLGELE